MIEETVKVFLHASSWGEKNDFVLLDFFVVVDRSQKVFKSQRDIELLRKDTFESLWRWGKKGFCDYMPSLLCWTATSFFLFAMIYFAHKTTFETITCHGFIFGSSWCCIDHWWVNMLVFVSMCVIVSILKVLLSTKWAIHPHHERNKLGKCKL